MILSITTISAEVSFTALSTEKDGTISSQVTGPNVGVLIAAPVIACIFLACLILVVSIIVYFKKSQRCKTLNIGTIYTNKTNSDYTHIPLVEDDHEASMDFDDN